MQEKNNNNEFRCYDNYDYIAQFFMLIFLVLVIISITITIVIKVINGWEFYPVGLVCLLTIVLPFLICCIILIIVLCTSRQCVFSINNDTYKLFGKKFGKSINIERKTSDIRRIVIKGYGRVKLIILEDSIGKMGNSASTFNDEYIKLRYSESLLKSIQRYLPDIPVYVSHNSSKNEI